MGSLYVRNGSRAEVALILQFFFFWIIFARFIIIHLKWSILILLLLLFYYTDFGIRPTNYKTSRIRNIIYTHQPFFLRCLTFYFLYFIVVSCRNYFIFSNWKKGKVNILYIIHETIT